MGRLALVGLSALLVAPATILSIVGMTAVRQAPEGAQFFSLFFVGAGFLYLVAGAFIVLAFVPSHDMRRGPPRGFTTLNAVFDGFWTLVQKIYEHWH